MQEVIRKKDVREKIQLGGLIVKAGLRNADKKFILGILIKAAELEKNSLEYKTAEDIGKKAFLEK